MTKGRIGIIQQYKLEKEVDDLLARCYGDSNIAKIIDKRHPEIQPPISRMAYRR